MSYHRTASAHSLPPRLTNRQASAPTSRRTASQSPQLPVRSRANKTSHLLPANRQISQHSTVNPTARQLAGQPVGQSDDSAQAGHRQLHSPEAAFIARYRGIFSQQTAWVGIGAIAIVLLAVVPMRVDSESIDLFSCDKKIKPTGEISRGQMSALLALPTGANKEAVRRVVEEPYCTLPGMSESDAANASANAEEHEAIAGAEREAYPLAFDPEAWVVVAYADTGEYLGYDFVFKP